MLTEDALHGMGIKQLPIEDEGDKATRLTNVTRQCLIVANLRIVTPAKFIQGDIGHP